MEDIRDGNKKLIVKKDFDYGYAITVHKSQGSTYNTIFITENVIDQNPLNEERNKLKYVALSRPTTLAGSLSNGKGRNSGNTEPSNACQSPYFFARFSASLRISNLSRYGTYRSPFFNR